MTRTEIDSSMLASAGYDDFQTILEVEFTSGEVYHYYDVPPDIYDGLMDAESKGTFMNVHVLPVFRYSRVRPNQ